MSFDINSELFALKTFERYNDEMKYIIDSTSSLYLKIVNLKTFDELSKMLKLLDLDTNSICAKEITNLGGWCCADCVRSDNSIYCQECWSQMKDKHKGHKIVFTKKVDNGTCDCGDHNYIDNKYFCPKHKGIFQSDLFIEKYIKQSLGEKLPLKLISINQIMFDNMANYFFKEINAKNKSKEFPNIVKDFINCFGLLCERSTACNFIIGDLLLKKYPFEVKHTCLDFDDNNGRIIKGCLNSHKCTCHFIRYILEFWPGQKQNLIYKLIGNYKLKKIIGIYYFLFFNEYIKNLVNDFEDLDFQIIFKDVLQIVCNIDGLIDTIYEGMIEIFNLFLNKKTNDKTKKQETILSRTLENLYNNEKYLLFKKKIERLRSTTCYTIKNITFNYLSNNTNILFKLIDMLSILHNANPVKVIFPHPDKNQGFKYEIELLNIELNTLGIFSLFTSIFNFDNNDLVKNVFHYFSKIINEKIKNELNENEYSFHICLYRAFSIFVNRYCFHEANKNNSNIYKSFNNVDKLFKDFDKCSKVMIKSIYKVFGFITACKEGMFSYYGPDMIQYEYIYYNYPIFIYMDFSLLKYLLSMKENLKYLVFNEILALTQVENSNKPIQDFLLKKNIIDTPDLWLHENNKIYLKFFSKILGLILNLLTNNFCHIWILCSPFSELKTSKIKDKLIEDLLNKDRNIFIEMIKEIIINKLITKENSANYTDIKNGIFECLKDFFGEEKIKEIIISLTNKTLTQDCKAIFSLKDEFMNYIDLNYIINPILKTKAEKYISEFKSNLVSIFNIHFYPVNKFESKLTNVIYNHLFFNKKNFDFLFQFTSFILSQKNSCDFLIDNILPVLLNYLSIFFEHYSHLMFLRENSKINKIMELLENNYLKDEVKKSHCIYTLKKFKEKSLSNNLSNTKESNKNYAKSASKNIKSAMKEKMKNKFKNKNDNLVAKLGLSKKISAEINNESCIICHKTIDQEDINKPYGLIGNILNDNFFSNAFYQSIEKEYKKFNVNEKLAHQLRDLFMRSFGRKSKRIISCNHYIHFDCFFKQYMNYDLNKPLYNFACPLCHRLSCFYIPMLINYTDKEIKGYLKGFNFNYIFNYGKLHLKKDEKTKRKDIKDNVKIKLVNKDAFIFKKAHQDFVNSCKQFIERFFKNKKNYYFLN